MSPQTLPVYRWSPGPPESYGYPDNMEVEAWNLAWLTLPQRSGGRRKSPPHDEALTHSLQCIARVNQNLLSMTQLLRLPPRHFVSLCRAATWDEEPGLMVEDDQWRRHWSARVRRARTDHPQDLNLCIDLDIVSTQAARRLLEAKGWATTFQEEER